MKTKPEHEALAGYAIADCHNMHIGETERELIRTKEKCI